MNKTTTIALALLLTCVIYPSPVSAAIYRVDITQDKTIFDLSQQLSVQIVDVQPKRSFIFVELTMDSENDFYIRIRPATILVHYRLIDRGSRHVETQLLATDQYGKSIAAQKVAMTTESSIYLVEGTDVNFYRSELNKRSVEISKTQPTAVSTDGGLSIDIKPTAILRNFTLQISEGIPLPLPIDLDLLSPLYEFDISDKSAVITDIPITIKMQYTDDGSESKSIYFFDKVRATWIKLPSYNNVEEHTVAASIHLTYAPLGIFSDGDSADGIASWYAYKNCLCAASRDYPRGTQLRVTRLKSGKSIVVTVNDYGPEEKTGRIIDLDKRAFLALGSLNSGLIYVNIHPENEQNE